jgi:hypothetical protein
MGMGTIALEVLADNAHAIAIYAACGFRIHERHGALLHMVRVGHE